MSRLIFIRRQPTYSAINIVNGLFFLLTFALFGSCKQKNSQIGSIQKQLVVTSKKNKSTATTPDTILNTITDYVDGRCFVMTCSSGYNLVLKNEKGDTLYQDSVYSPEQVFLDFNGDGYKDILIDYMTSIPGVRDLLLYDLTNKTYRKVIDFQDFPSTERLGYTRYYYSYHRSGCADLNWDSDLFYIENYKTIRIGNIGGRDCKNTGVKDGIYISKIIGQKEIEVQKLDISIIKKYKDHKWGFIAEYWRKNYKKFL